MPVLAHSRRLPPVYGRVALALIALVLLRIVVRLSKWLIATLRWDEWEIELPDPQPDHARATSQETRSPQTLKSSQNG